MPAFAQSSSSFVKSNSGFGRRRCGRHPDGAADTATRACVAQPPGRNGPDLVHIPRFGAWRPPEVSAIGRREGAGIAETDLIADLRNRD